MGPSLLRAEELLGLGKGTADDGLLSEGVGQEGPAIPALGLLACAVNAGLCGQYTVRPSRLWTLEQRKVYCKTRQGDGVAHALKPRTPQRA